jgi:phosphohistidine phosphatase
MKMKVYLMQHGIAKTKEEDPEQGLTEQGIKDTEKVSQFIGKMGLDFESIFYSEKLRAAQTAQILGKYLRLSLGVHEADLLGPDGAVETWKMRLLCSEGDTVLVSHLPLLDKLVSSLVINDSDKPIVQFKNNSIVCLEEQKNEIFDMKWLVTPEMLG